jgi:hypothetical protein
VKSRKGTKMKRKITPLILVLFLILPASFGGRGTRLQGLPETSSGRSITGGSSMPISGLEEELPSPAGKQSEVESISFWASLYTAISFTTASISIPQNCGFIREMFLKVLSPSFTLFFIKDGVQGILYSTVLN